MTTEQRGGAAEQIREEEKRREKEQSGQPRSPGEESQGQTGQQGSQQRDRVPEQAGPGARTSGTGGDERSR